MRSSRKSGFSLIELLVVIGLIALVMTGIGLVRLNQTPANRISAAERMIIGKLRYAQNQSIISGNRTRFMVVDDSGSRDHLRLLAVVEQRQGPSGNSVWYVVGQNARLPRGVYVVPTSSSDAGVAWAGPISEFSNNSEIVTFDPNGRGSLRFRYVEFQPGGWLDSLSQFQYLSPDIDPNSLDLDLYISSATPNAQSTLTFSNPDLLGAVRILPDGTVTTIAQ